MALTVLALAAALATGSGAAPPETIAFARGKRVFTARPDGSGQKLVLELPIVPLSRKVIDVAFDRSGQLYVSQPDGDDTADSCDLYRIGRRAPVLRFSAVHRRTGAESGLCEIATDPRGGILFDITVRGRSYHVRRFQPGTRRLDLIAFGCLPSFAPDGKRLVVVAPCSIDRNPTLQLGRPSRLASFKPIVPASQKRRPVGYLLPAFSPDGKQIAAIRFSPEQGTLHARRTDLVVGRPGGRLRSVLGFDGPALGRVAWLRDGRTLLVEDFRPRGGNLHGDVYRVRLDGSKPRRILENVETFAVHSG